MNSGNENGISLLEVIFSIAIFSLVAVAAAEHVGLSWTYTSMNRDRIFAYRKAQSILAELQAFVDSGEVDVAADLDRFDDGTGLEDTLTITEADGQLVDPEHPASQNCTTEGNQYLWARQISVRPFPGQQTRDVRFVTVRVFRRGRDGSRPRMAEMSSVIRSIGQSYPTTQVYDVYLLALENIPGWWVYMDSIRPFVESTLTDLEARNPGLEFRTHWITKSGYGRDPLYSPYMNDAVDSREEIPGVYFYPGKMPSGSAAARYYVPEEIRGMKNLDGNLVNHISDSPYPYTLADQFNHCMRLPDAMRLFQKRVAVGLEDPQKPTWRLLLEEMISHPDKFHNAILVNLHGELLPMPAMRNYSDPAKDPGGRPGARVVTHSENLRHDSSTGKDVKLRVYAYKAPSTATSLTEADTVTVRIKGLTLPAAGMLISQLNDPEPDRRPVLIEKIEELSSAANGPTSYQKDPVVPGWIPATGNPRGERMYVGSAAVDGGDLVLKVHNTPLTCPKASDLSGLRPKWRLYGMDYVPTPLGPDGDFSQDLTSTLNRPNNTARWIITLRRAPSGSHPSYLPPAALGNRILTVETCLGDTPGTRYPRILGWDAMAPDLLGNPRWSEVTPVNPLLKENWEPASVWEPQAELENRWPAVTPPYIVTPTNVSRTYVYWTEEPEDVPFTERYQFLGDPRHCPYTDTGRYGTNFKNGFNWFFDNMRNGDGNFNGKWGFAINRLFDGWKGRLEFDVPRFFQTLRTALTRAEVLYTTLTGFSYYYVGIGNEIGYDSSNGFPSSIPLDGKPYGTTSDVFVDSISENGDSNYRYVKTIREAGTSSYWWGVSWLGELYPDSAYGTHWRTTGNLPAGNSAGHFFRDRRQDVTRNLPKGTTLVASKRVTAAEGCTSFFNIGTSSATFHHQFADGRYGDLTDIGQEIAGNYNFSLPTSTKISRPFNLATNRDGGVGPEFGFTSDYPRFSAQIVKTYYDHSLSASTGSALVALRPPEEDRTAYIVVNGIDRTTESGSAFISKYSVLTLLHSLLEAGDGDLPGPVTRLPRGVITSPTGTTELTNPVQIPIKWETLWTRWDGRPYTSSTSSNNGENETRLRYSLLYSTDNGQTWKHVLNDSIATPGRLPAAALLLVDQGTGPEQYDWPTPAAKFPEGSYLIRIEVFRSMESLHYAHHTEKIYIDR